VSTLGVFVLLGCCDLAAAITAGMSRPKPGGAAPKVPGGATGSTRQEGGRSAAFLPAGRRAAGGFSPDFPLAAPRRAPGLLSGRGDERGPGLCPSPAPAPPGGPDA
jgi:hypothetical protein